MSTPHLLTLAILTTLMGPAPAGAAGSADAGDAGPIAAGEPGKYEDATDIWKAVGIGGQESSSPKPFEPVLAALPAVGYNPAAGLLLGVLGSVGIYFGDLDTTTISSGSLLALVSTNRQLILQANAVVMTERNEWELQSDWRLLLYNQDTYGLGTGTPPVSTGISVGGLGSTAAVPGGQPMDFDLIRIHQVALRRVAGALYVGGGYRFDRYFGVVDKQLDLTATPPVVTSNHAYSTYFGFSPSAYSVSSVSLSLLYDSRDSTINPYRGLYANVDYRISPTFLGSSKASTLLFGEIRHYVGLSSTVPRNVLALWLLAQGVLTGEMPYLALPSTAWDARNATGRGFVQGRFRGPSEIYGEAELRLRITANGLVGGTLFASARTFSRPPVSIPGYSNKGEALFDTVAVGGGVGLRFMLSRETRNNVRLDLGFGQGSAVFYLGLGEVF